MLISIKMSWITEMYIKHLFEKRNGLTARVINECIGGSLTSSALNKHLRNLLGAGGLYRKMEHGAYVYYKNKNFKRVRRVEEE